VINYKHGKGEKYNPNSPEAVFKRLYGEKPHQGRKPDCGFAEAEPPSVGGRIQFR
jgi:hypothetical protein